MNALTATLAAGRRKLSTVADLSSKVGDLIAPRDHAGKGNWNEDADIPWWAWPASLVLAAFFLFGPQTLSWLLDLAS
ncbi:MAG: hypothetical protein E2591_00565 [Achromobacter sp.]|uniref:hypothetical protein n=1 Tax=Achromobacter sp. TaxID=134375 RepID=UPI0012CC1A2F|nr:hypothetical protein [Achromobacter sp.]